MTQVVIHSPAGNQPTPTAVSNALRDDVCPDCACELHFVEQLVHERIVTWRLTTVHDDTCPAFAAARLSDDEP